MNIPFQNEVVIFLMALALGVFGTRSYLVTKHENELNAISSASSLALSKAKEEAAEAAVSQLKQQANIVSEYNNKLREKEHELVETKKNLDTSNTSLADTIARLLDQGSIPGDTNSTSGSVPGGPTSSIRIQERLNEIDQRIIERTQQGDRAIAAYWSCYATYEAARKAVNKIGDKPTK